MSENVVIVGGGQAGAQCATSLRAEGWSGNIIMISDEAYLPYQRPPLSKQFLAGEVTIDRVYVRPAEFYQDKQIEVRQSRQAQQINRDKQTVMLDDGNELSFAHLVLATGSRVRQLGLPGSSLSGIQYLRTIDDMQQIQSYLQQSNKLVIVGGGYIGLEVAAVARQKGLDVVVLEMASRLLQRVAGEQTSQFYHAYHNKQGVSIHCGAQVTGFSGSDTVTAVLCADGSSHAADAVVVGVGIVPVTELAESAQLTVANGIVVDEYCRTSDANIYAIGDCSNHMSQRLQRRLRLESVPNALGQARTAAATICGNDKPYSEIPWFWSDQYDLKLQMAGILDGYDEVVMRGDPGERKFMVCYLKEQRLHAVESVNNPKEFMLVRQLLNKNTQVAIEQLADSSVDMKAIVAAA